MAITRFKNSSIANKGPKYDNALAGLPYIPIIGTATDGGNGTSVSVAFTGNNVAGAGITYTALSTPGSITATGAVSPITVTGLTSGTEYTFRVKAGNSLGDSAYSAASNSVTPVTPTSFESIATQTLSSTATSVTFSSIPSTYQHLQIRCLVKVNGSGGGSWPVDVQVNGDTGSNYAYHLLRGNGSAVNAYGYASQTKMQLGNANYDTGNTAGVAIIDIHDYASTTKNKTFRAFNGLDGNVASTNYHIFLASGVWLSTSAITSISLNGSGTDFASGSTFALYGIR